MKKVSTKEFIWYAVSGIITVFGLICIIFGIIGYNMKGSAEQNFVVNFEKGLPFELRYWGLIFVAVGVFLAIIVLLVNAKKADREVEKRLRRDQRLAAQANMNVEVKKAVEIVEDQAQPAQ